MVYLAFIWHMHQPYYHNLLTGEINLPWVRLHGVKDYLDMLKILEPYPEIHQTFNLVPSLIEQINFLAEEKNYDKFFKISEKHSDSLTNKERQFIIDNFFIADEKRMISIYPRYYELYLRAKAKKQFNNQDILDLQVFFNLVWIDPYFRESSKELKAIIKKARFFSEDDKKNVLSRQLEIIKNIIPEYNKFQDSGQIEICISPYYHPILPLLYNGIISRTANKRTKLPKKIFKYPNDCYWHINEAVQYYKKFFSVPPQGMWPSEEAISKHIMPLFIKSGIKWIVSDEAIILKTLKKKERDSNSIYRPYTIHAENGKIDIIFRDGNLSNLISFLYQHWEPERAVGDFMKHLKNINNYFKDKDCLVTIALDGENAWEYYRNDGLDFLNLLYKTLSESSFIKTVTVNEYLTTNSHRTALNKIASGSWINGDFTKWMGNPVKNRAWELLLEAREHLDRLENPSQIAWKQIHILEGSDWFWWYGERQRQFDELFRMHLKNFYKIIGQKPSVDLDIPLE